MADTYGYKPDGTKQYDPGQYDQWGVYMGNRGPTMAQSNVQTPAGFNAWTSDLGFDQWLPEYAKTQLARGRGSLGAEVTAAQGTPEYREQIAARQQAAQWILDRGGTVGDMGIRPAKGAGLNMWNQYKDVKGGTYSDRFRQQALNMYNRRAEMAARANHGAAAQTAVPGASGQFGGGAPATGGGTFTPGQTTPPVGTTQQGFGAPGMGSPGLAPPPTAGMPQANPSAMLIRRGRGLKGLAGV